MVLSGDQFGGDAPWYPGQRRDLPGEPHPDEYGRYDDFLADHKRFIHAQQTGKRYVDRDFEKVRQADREETKVAEVEAKTEYRGEVKRKAAGWTAVKRSLPAKRKASPMGGLGKRSTPTRRRRGGL